MTLNVLPTNVRQRLREVRNGIRQQVREWRIPRIVRHLEQAPSSSASIMPLVAKLKGTWGNSGYSADLGYLEEIVVRSLASTGPFLECGSGLSTIVLGAVAKRNGAAVWSLEQDNGWASAMQTRVCDLALHNVHVIHAPLEVNEGTAWYAFDDRSLPRMFAVVFCDGPSVRKSQWPYDVYWAWRSALLAQLERRAITFGSVVLDDAEDRRCGQLIETWRRAGLRVDIVATPFGRHVVGERSSTTSVDEGSASA